MMGSRKKKTESESSSSSSESDSNNSDSSPEKKVKQKKSREKDSEVERTNSKPKKRESTPEERPRRGEAPDRDTHKVRKRGRTPSPEDRSKRTRDDRRRNDYNDRYRNYRNDGNRRDRRDDRDFRNRRYFNRDNRDKHNRDNRRRRSRSNSFDHTNAKWGKEQDNKKSDDKKDSKTKEKPNFGLSGKLTEETNTYRGVVIKYSEPPEACKPKRRWRLYPFKGEKALQTLYIHRESAYLIGRDRKVVDLPVDHPSCSKQHAALQYRLVPFTRDDGTVGKRVRPYLIDLNSANGTYINNKKIESSKYVELLEKDVIKFGFSSREYVLLHENSKDEALDDDVKQDEETTVKEEKKDE